MAFSAVFLLSVSAVYHMLVPGRLPIVLPTGRLRGVPSIDLGKMRFQVRGKFHLAENDGPRIKGRESRAENHAMVPAFHFAMFVVMFSDALVKSGEAIRCVGNRVVAVRTLRIGVGDAVR
jgi:hypothetical protein